MHVVLSLLALLTLAACQPAVPALSLPTPRAGADVLGLEARHLLPLTYAGARAKLNDKVTLIRFWTDKCPFCKNSLPALEQLRQEYEERGLVTVGVYHPKPPRGVNDRALGQVAESLGYHGFVAVDPYWKSLRAIWLDSAQREATSASFLLDRSGRVRFVHPGPEFHPGNDPEHSQCHADFEALRTAIEFVLSED